LGGITSIYISAIELCICFDIIFSEEKIAVLQKFYGCRGRDQEFKSHNFVVIFAIVGDINREMAGRAVNNIYITKMWEHTICCKNFAIMYTVKTKFSINMGSDSQQKLV
jgi:hypothetical protein